MLNLLSLDLNLMVLALMLIILWRVESRGKKANLGSIGKLLIAFGLFVLIVGGVTWALGQVQVWDVFKNTGLSIFTAGILLLIQGEVQKKPANLPVVRTGANVISIVVVLIALAVLIWFFKTYIPAS